MKRFEQVQQCQDAAGFNAQLVNRIFRKFILAMFEPLAIAPSGGANTLGQMSGEFGWKIRVHSVWQG